jgi:hypothetical protein
LLEVSRALGHAGVLRGRPEGIRIRQYRRFVLGVAACSILLVAIINPRGGAESHWQRLFDATYGPHVTVSALPGVDLKPLMNLSGLTTSSGPFPGVNTSVRFRGTEIGLYVEGRPTERSSVDRPAIVSGKWVRPRALVLQPGVADRLAVRPGSHVQVKTTRGWLRLLVSGVVDTTATARYLQQGEGIGYVLPDTLGKIEPSKRVYGETLFIRLADAGASSAFVKWISANYPGHQAGIYDWRARHSAQSPRVVGD